MKNKILIFYYRHYETHFYTTVDAIEQSNLQFITVLESR